MKLIDKSALVAEIERRMQEHHSGYLVCLKDMLSFLDTLEVKEVQEEPVSEDLEEAARKAGQKYFPDEENIWARPNYEAKRAECAFKEGAEWQREHLCKPTDGDDLPEVDREVIALVEENEHYKVVFAHRPPKHWDGKNILTGKVTRYEPKRYDKGGWNMPNIKYWLDVDLPKMEE